MVISKKVIGVAAVGALAPVEGHGQRRLVDRLAVQQDALVEADEMRARCSGRPAGRRPRSMAASMASVEPLPLVPAMWTTGGSRRSG